MSLELRELKGIIMHMFKWCLLALWMNVNAVFRGLIPYLGLLWLKICEVKIKRKMWKGEMTYYIVG